MLCTFQLLWMRVFFSSKLLQVKPDANQRRKQPKKKHVWVVFLFSNPKNKKIKEVTAQFRLEMPRRPHGGKCAMAPEMVGQNGEKTQHCQFGPFNCYTCRHFTPINSLKKCVAGFITYRCYIGVITPLITGRGPPCGFLVFNLPSLKLTAFFPWKRAGASS